MGIKSMIKKNSVFLDTSYAIALSSFGDQYHQQAIAVADYLVKRNISIVTRTGLKSSSRVG